MKGLHAIVLFACLVGCARRSEVAKPLAAAAEQPDVKQVALTYRSLRAMTKEPVYVNPMFAAMCRNVSQEEVEAARRVFGPHANTAVRIYMNDLAAETFGKANPVYPVGSIVVKEKEPMGYWSTTQRAMVEGSDGVGGMIKRPAGYDPDHGDWEYFYFEDPAKVESGKIISCVQCHSGAAGQDHVFGSWAHENPWHREPLTKRGGAGLWGFISYHQMIRWMSPS